MNRTPLTAALALAGALLLAACSSSSNPGSDSGGQHGASAGRNHAPSSPPGSSSSAASASYEHVSAAAAKRLEKKLPTMAGVLSDTYYPATKVFVVYFSATATTSQRADIARQITQVSNQ